MDSSQMPCEIQRLFEIKAIRENNSIKWKQYLSDKLSLNVKPVNFISDNSFTKLMQGLESANIVIDDLIH